MAISDYNTSAASNLTLGSIPVGPGMEREKVNNAIQQLMADIAAYKGNITETIFASNNGVVADGTADDTSALQAAITATPTGGTLVLPEGTIKLSASLVITKPIVIKGGAKEQTILNFLRTATFKDIGDGTKAGIIVLHSSSVLSGYTAGSDARRSRFEGFTVQLDATGTLPTGVRGIVNAAPMDFYNVDSKSWSSDGFGVIAGVGQPLVGNSNGTLFQACISQSNDGSGFTLIGNDANACVFIGCRAPDNGSYGFYDDSLLGNTYLQCEADNNTTAGFYTNAAKPIRSTYLGCYSETAGHFVVGPLCLIIGSQGVYKPAASSGGVGLHGLPVGIGYITKGVAFASTDDIANSLGDTPNAGKMLYVSNDGIDFKGDSAGLHVKLTGVNSSNYTDLMNGTNNILRMPKSAISGNLNAATPWMPGGFVIGDNVRSGIIGAGAAAPTTGTYALGAIWLNESPAPSGTIGWVCTTAGTPGTWKTWGAISA